jgi:large subunit ribosomal protein L6
MSRIGKAPVAVPDKVEVTVANGALSVKGPQGTLTQVLLDGVSCEQKDNRLYFSITDPLKGAMHGTMRALAANMIKGVLTGFEKRLTLVGVGFRAQLQGDSLNLQLGFSHPIIYKLPAGVKAETPQQTEIVIKGADKQAVGQVAANIRAFRPPEPYKGKGVRYSDERVVIKETKKK